MGSVRPAEATTEPDPERVHEALRKARNGAAPIALAAAGILIALALVAVEAHWETLGRQVWWMWLVVATPYALLARTLFLGLNRLARHDHRREVVIGLRTLVWAFNVAGVAMLVAARAVNILL